MVRETCLTVDDLIYPLFVKAGKNERTEIPSMPGIHQYSPDTLIPELGEVQSLASRLFYFLDYRNARMKLAVKPTPQTA